MRRVLPCVDVCWLGGCYSTAGLVEAGHQCCCRRRHSGAQRLREGLGAAFGSEDVMSIISGLNTLEKMAQMC